MEKRLMEVIVKGNMRGEVGDLFQGKRDWTFGSNLGIQPLNLYLSAKHPACSVCQAQTDGFEHQTCLQ